MKLTLEQKNSVSFVIWCLVWITVIFYLAST